MLEIQREVGELDRVICSLPADLVLADGFSFLSARTCRISLRRDFVALLVDDGLVGATRNANANHWRVTGTTHRREGDPRGRRPHRGSEANAVGFPANR